MGLHKSYNINFQKFPQNVKIKKIISDNNRQLRRLSNFGKTQFVEAQNYNIKKNFKNFNTAERAKIYQN